MRAIRRRLFTWPAYRHWIEAFALLSVFGVVSTILIVISGRSALASEEMISLPFPVFAIVALIIPAFAEEVFFRGLCQPRDIRGFQSILISAASLACFIAWHPVQLWSGLPMGQLLFTQPVFLGLVALLGIICTISVHRSGSLWPAVIMHWLVVLSWKAFFA